jgi:hypothetical protein
VRKKSESWKEAEKILRLNSEIMENFFEYRKRMGGVSTKKQRVDPILAGAHGSERSFSKLLVFLGD